MTDLWYHVEGSGPPLVLLHESVVDSRIWSRFLPFVTDRLTTIAYDQRGYGRSPAWDGAYSAADDLVSVLDAAGVERGALLGTSRGGRIAIQAALAHPERVSALILAVSGLAGRPVNIDITPEQEARWDEAEVRGDLAELVEIDLEIWDRRRSGTAGLLERLGGMGFWTLCSSAYSSTSLFTTSAPSP
jgi:3-oxoadipate enol-lactonase